MTTPETCAHLHVIFDYAERVWRCPCGLKRVPEYSGFARPSLLPLRRSSDEPHIIRGEN